MAEDGPSAFAGSGSPRRAEAPPSLAEWCLLVLIVLVPVLLAIAVFVGAVWIAVSW